MIPPQFDIAADFSESLARVMIDKIWGYIGKSGQFIIPPQFDEAWDFSKGIARVMIDEQERYIDKKGRFIY
ncbi:WG repeat-containing protein [Anabaena sp. AL09]|uniref:WG repeat-containing protein n=1 Tax=Anabaena sp. AL09 TaxID=1710891 RepID=UPI003459C846